MQTTMPRRPVRQHLRILTLRLFALALLALVLFTRSAWQEHDALFDVFEVSGIFLVIAAVIGRFWAILYIGGEKNRRVVQDGPYSICRHPLYLASTLGALGFGLMLGSLVLALVIGGGTLAILWITAGREEAYLRQEFGPAYDAYAARVPRILPDPRLYSTPSTVTFDVAPLVATLADAMVFLSFIPLAEVMELVHEAGLWPSLVLW